MKELNREQLLEIASPSRVAGSCSVCSTLTCSGWISKPGYFDLANLRVLGTLKKEGAQESWDEYHPEGTNFWSDNAPISLQHHPDHRCNVLECISCKRKFLHYTEYGGYYLDERVRELNKEYVV